MVVHGLDGLDEISTVGKTAVAWLKDGKVTELEVSPTDFGVKTGERHRFESGNLYEESTRKLLFKILSGNIAQDDPKMEFVLVNSAAGIVVGGKADDFEGGMELARESIYSGAAYDKLKAFNKSFRRET